MALEWIRDREGTTNRLTLWQNPHYVRVEWIDEEWPDGEPDIDFAMREMVLALEETITRHYGLKCHIPGCNNYVDGVLYRGVDRVQFCFQCYPQLILDDTLSSEPAI